MPIVGGLDIHRKQLTFDYLDTWTGEVGAARSPRRGAPAGGPLPLGETAGTRARRLPLTPGSRRPACCGVRSEPDPLALARARCAEPGDGLDGAQARLRGRLSGIVDEYLREDRPR